eukprot:TRINITY_DN3727_c0_g2_i2.p1 TRINITY_DN3727_c0_g2~~TRINITY_DN3727_c0_g2_i2.p1  ORF type:complete len:394 (-),score=126.09 TRINITY_DN3727_c0_g2_i2:72-1253(-)
MRSYALFEDNGQQIDPGLVAHVGDVFEEILEETRKLRDELREDMNMREALAVVMNKCPHLRLSGAAYEVMQWYICRMEGWFATDLSNLSLLHWDKEDLMEGGHGLMVKGYAPVLRALADGLDICFNNCVKEVVRKPDGVCLTTEEGKIFTADAAIITVPLGVLKANSVSFSPPLPPWKASAIEQIGVGTENKVVLLFEEACWPNVEFLGVVSSTSSACSYFLNLHKAMGRPVLVYMPAGQLAKALEEKSDADAVEFVISQLRRILPHASKPLQFIVSRWGSDPNSRGSYTFDAVGKPADAYDRLRAPVPPLFFAGEATSRNYPGMVHGAFQTGMQAAEECKRMLRGRDRCRGEGDEVSAASSSLSLFATAAAADGAGTGEEGGPFLPLQISRL